MNIRVFATNNLGKIEFDRASLEKVLNEIYEEGYRAGEKHAKDNYWTWCPSITTTTIPCYNTTSDTTSITGSLKDNSYATTTTTAATANTTPTLNTNSATGSINTATEIVEKEIPTIDTSFSINGEKVDLSTFANSFKEANEAFNRAVNSISRSNRYNTLAKEIESL